MSEINGKNNGKCDKMGRCLDLSKLYSLRKRAELTSDESGKKIILEERYHIICTTGNYVSCPTRRGFVGR